MDQHLADLIALANPWLSSPERFELEAAQRLPAHYRARQLQDSLAWPTMGKAHLLIGARQVGKSSLIWHYFAEAGTPPLFLNCEEAAVRRWCQSPTLFASQLQEIVQPGVPLFFEEAQHLAEAGLFFKGLIDARIPHAIYVTGSSSFHLRARTRESLAGRATRAVLAPFSFEEICPAPIRPAIWQQRQLREALERHMIFGGYPEVWSSDQPQNVLLSLLEAYVLRDASDMFRIQQLDAFRRPLGLIAGQIGSLVQLSEWAQICGINRETLSGYLDILIESHIVFMLRPFAQGKRSELTRQPKVYFSDNGLRHMQLRNFSTLEMRSDQGAVVENWVGSELNKAFPWALEGPRLHFWRSKAKAEVDFVVQCGDRTVGIEVKSGILKQQALTRSSRSFIAAYKPAQFFVLNRSFRDQTTVEGTVVQWLPFIDIDQVLAAAAEHFT
jgi:predicted AAA+ superfamily ATPase